MEIRIKKRTSISKINKEKPMNMTVSAALFPASQKQIKNLPPIKRNLRKPLEKISLPQKSIVNKQIKQISKRKQTETTLNESSMQQSYFFSTMSKGWIKPSDYLNDINQLNLEGEENIIQISNYEIKLNDNIQKNMKKIESLFQLTQKWVDILKRAMFYISSKKSNSEKLSQQIKFWRSLSKKFDELQYQFNNQKTKKLYVLMKSQLKTNQQYRKAFEQFEILKQEVIENCIMVKRLYLTLQEIVAGLIIKFQECSCIKESIQLLKRILFCFNNLSESNHLLDNRLEIIYKKMNLSLIQKLIAAPIYPKELANVSGLKFRYQIINNAMSFYSNFISVLEQNQDKNKEIIEEAQYTQIIISNLMEILCYFQYLYKKKEVLQFSKLFGYEIDFNIFDKQNKLFWLQYMEIVQQSMESKKYQS